jgi:hypothetical protein
MGNKTGRRLLGLGLGLACQKKNGFEKKLFGWADCVGGAIWEIQFGLLGWCDKTRTRHDKTRAYAGGAQGRRM